MNKADFFVPAGSTRGQTGSDHRAVDSGVTRKGSVAVRRGPIGDIAADGRGTTVVTHPGDDSVSLLNARTLAVEAIIAVHGEPYAVAVTDDRAYVSTSSWSHKDGVTIIDTESKAVIGSYEVEDNITALAVSPDGKRVYAGRTGDGRIDVAVIDITADRVGTIDVATGAGIGIDAIDVDPTGTKLFVATTDARGSALLVVGLETARIEQAVPIGAPIRDFAVADGTAYVLTSDRTRGGVVNVVDLRAARITNLVELHGAPTQLVLAGDQARLYVVDYDRVVVMCALTLAVADSITVDARPSCVAVDAHGRRLQVADYAGSVTSFGIDTGMPLLYSQFMATDPVEVPEVRELEPVTA